MDDQQLLGLVRRLGMTHLDGRRVKVVTLRHGETSLLVLADDPPVVSKIDWDALFSRLELQ